VDAKLTDEEVDVKKLNEINTISRQIQNRFIRLRRVSAGQLLKRSQRRRMNPTG